MTTYIETSWQLVWNQWHNYGSSRLGVVETNTLLVDALGNPPPASLPAGEVTFYRGTKRDELSNHPPAVGQALGNVLAVITDRRLQACGADMVVHYNAQVVSVSDYYPFGMGIKERSWSDSSFSYRFAFNGYENEPDISGQGSVIDFGARIYDSSLGRFFSTDPIVYPSWSPYQYDGNSPISTKNEEGKGPVNSFFQKVGSALSGNGWNNNYELLEKSAAAYENKMYDEIAQEQAKRIETTEVSGSILSSVQIHILARNIAAQVYPEVYKEEVSATPPSLFERWKAFDESLVGSYDGSNSGSMSKTSKRVQSATFNTVVGGASVGGEVAAAPVSGGASLLATPFSIDQFCEGVNEFRAIYNGEYDDKEVYGTLRSAAYDLSEKYTGDKKSGVYIFNGASVLTGATGLMKSAQTLNKGSGTLFDINAVVGAAEGIPSDANEINGEVKR